MWSLILVSMRADSIPFAWGKGLVTSMLLNLQKSGYPSDEIAIAHDGRQHRRGTGVACIAFEGSGAVGGVPTLEESELGDHPKHVKPYELRSGSFIDRAQVELG